jgi:hypothetical protein
MIIGFILKKITKAEKCGEFYRYNIKGGSVSLGKYIFLCPSHYNDDEVLRHEKGHSKQSLYLGWLYLFVIGIPSFVWASCFGWYREKRGLSYYDFYTEKWADRLAGIERR